MRDGLLPGDLLFQDRSLTAFGQAISAVFSGWQGHPVTHCGLLVEPNLVIEAVAEGVVLTPLPRFLDQGNPGSAVLHGRLTPEWQAWIPEALDWARRQVGRPYNFSFAADAPGLYCSQLVCQAFARAAGQPVLPENPMNFRGPDGDILPYWQEFYAGLGQNVPQDQPGSHPAVVSLSPRLIVQVLRTATQMKRAPSAPA